jgi:CBS domain-containing membrane protein
MIAAADQTAQARRQLRNWLAAFVPAPMAVDGRERWRVVAGAVLGMLLTALLCQLSGIAHPALPWLVAPIGASTVLVFGVPASPMAQPWAVIGGNTVSALVGIAVMQAGLPTPLAAALAVSLAIGAMFTLRCLHPPGGASALLTVLAGVHDPRFALFPVLLNSLLLVAAGIAYNHATGRRYPHAQKLAPSAKGHARSQREADIDAALARYNQVLDISRDDLAALVEHAELQTYQRQLGSVRCGDIMTTDVATVEFGTPLQDAWALLRERRIKALPVLDRNRRVVGILTLADFLRGADLDLHHGFDLRLKALIRATPHSHSNKPEVVGQIMTRQVRVISEQRHIAELVPLFSDTGHHHIPVIADRERLVGIITQSDLVRALSHAAAKPGDNPSA